VQAKAKIAFRHPVAIASRKAADVNCLTGIGRNWSRPIDAAHRSLAGSDFIGGNLKRCNINTKVLASSDHPLSQIKSPYIGNLNVVYVGSLVVLKIFAVDVVRSDSKRPSPAIKEKTWSPAETTAPKAVRGRFGARPHFTRDYRSPIARAPESFGSMLQQTTKQTWSNRISSLRAARAEIGLAALHSTATPLRSFAFF
jgi:hypothetical protein